MMHPGRLVGLALTLLLLGHVSARACSPAPGFIRPSNFELVQDADVIVIATPINERGVPADPYKDVSFRTLQTIKGEVPETFEVGQLMLGRTRPSDPNQIMFSHPEGHMGPCNRMTLARGKSYVLLADLTHSNRGAYWEGGFAEGLGKPVVYTCKKAVWDKEKTHFDTNHLVTIIWDPANLPKAAAELKATIRATLPEAAKMTD